MGRNSYSIGYKREHEEAGDPLATAHPMATVKILGCLLADEPRRIAYDFGFVLRLAAGADRELRQYARWRRTNSLLQQ